MGEETKKQSALVRAYKAIERFVSSWGLLGVIIGLGIYFKDLAEDRTFSSDKMKYETEEHIENVPNDVDVYKQGQEFIQATKQLEVTQDSITSLAERIVADKANSEAAKESRQKRDSAFFEIVEVIKNTDSIEKVILQRMDALEKKVDTKNDSL